MANNNNSIFVPQTFNGARMVNVSKRTPTPTTTAASTSATPTSSSTATIAAATDTPPSVQQPIIAPAKEPNACKKDSKPDTHTANASPKSKVVPIKPYASSQSVIDARTKSTTASRGSISLSSKPSPPQQQQQQQQRSSQPPSTNQQVLMPSTFPNAYDIAGYERVWSEANVAVLIQLHRKHYNMVSSMDVDKYNEGWAALSAEYNAITADNRSVPVLIRKWDKLMAKYNAERAFLIMPRPQGLQQPLPAVSYWNHFQYMESYLSHVPLPENCILKRKQPRDNSDDRQKEASLPSSAKRPRSADLNMELLEMQRVFMEKTLDKQNTQIEMMRTNIESMHKMNMKFANICEKACTKSQLNEERYLNLLEKCLLLDKRETPLAPEPSASEPSASEPPAAKPRKPADTTVFSFTTPIVNSIPTSTAHSLASLESSNTEDV